MLRVERIVVDGNQATAVVDAAEVGQVSALHRRCVTCHGTNKVRFPAGREWLNRDVVGGCPKCLNGAHMFPLETRCSYRNGTAPKLGRECFGAVEWAASIESIRPLDGTWNGDWLSLPAGAVEGMFVVELVVQRR